MHAIAVLPWVVVGIGAFHALLGIVFGLIENALWVPESAKTPQEARAASRRRVQNILIPGLSGMTVGASILLGLLFPDMRSGGDDKQIAVFIVLFMLAVVVQGLVAWLSSADEPPVEVFYSSPERILLGIQEVDPTSHDAAHEVRRMRERHAEWRRSHGKKVFFVGCAKDCRCLNESLSWVPANPRLSMREAADVKKLMIVMWAVWRTGILRWISGVALLIVLLVLCFLALIILVFSAHLFFWWLILVVAAAVLWGGMDLVFSIKPIRWFARQKSFDGLVDAALVCLEDQILEAESARRLENGRIHQQLDRMEEAISRIERRLAQRSSPRGVVNLIDAVWRRNT